MTFKDKGINLVKSVIVIPQCVRFRYFEVEVIENQADCAIYVGIIGENDHFENNPATIDALTGKNM